MWLSFPAIDAQHYVSADAARGVLKSLQPPVITLGFHGPFLSVRDWRTKPLTEHYVSFSP